MFVLEFKSKLSSTQRFSNCFSNW